MSQEISILLDLKTAEALQKLGHFVDNASEGLKRLAEHAVAAFLSFEGLRKLEEGVSEAIKLEEAIGRLAQKTGLAVPTIAAMREEADKVGVPFDRLSFGLTTFSQKVFEAATQGGKAAETFQRLGVSLISNDGTLKNTDAILLSFLQRMKELPDGPQKAAAAMELFGRSGKELIPVLSEAADAVEKSRNSPGPISEESVAQAMEFEQRMREVKDAVEMMWVQVANKLLPSLNELANKLLEVSRDADKNREAVETLAGIIKGLITVIGVAAMAFYTLGAWIGSEAYIAWTNLGIAIDHVKQLLKDVANVAVSVVTLFADLNRISITLGQAWYDILTGNFTAAKDVIKRELNQIKMDLAGVLGAGAGTAADFLDMTSQMLETHKNEGDRFFNEMKRNWTSMADFLKNMWTEKPAAPHAPSEAATPFFPVNSQSVSIMGEMNRIAAELWKQQQKLIETDPFKTNLQKYNELLPLMQRQLDLVLQQYEASRKIYQDPNTSEKDRVAALKQMVQLQGQYNDLLGQMRNKAPDTFFSQMQRNAVAMYNTWGNISVNLANGAFGLITKGIQGMAQALTAVIMGTESAGKAFEQFAIQMLTSFIQMILESILYAEVAIPILTALGVLSGGTTAATGSATTIAAMSTTMAAVGGMVAARETGGPVQAGMPYIVGERRPELFIPDSNGFILPSVPGPQTGGAAGFGGSGETHIHLAFHGGEAAAKRWAQSRDGQTLIVDTNKRTVRRYSRA